IEAGGVEDRILLAEVTRQALFQGLVDLLRAADEAHRGHAVTELRERALARGPHRGMVGEPEVVVGAEVDHFVIARVDECTLRAGDHPLALVEPLLAEGGEVTPQPLEKCLIHNADYTEALRCAARAGGSQTGRRTAWGKGRI